MIYKIIFIILLLPSLSFAATATLVSGDEAETDILIYFWPANYTEAEITDPGGFEDRIDDWINATTGRLWDNNWFNSYKARFTFYKVVTSDVWSKTPEQIDDMLDGFGSCEFRESYTCREIDVIIDDVVTGNNLTDYIPGGGGGVYIIMDDTAVDSYNTLAHEFGVHGLGRGGEGNTFVDNEIILQLNDAYTGNGCSNRLSNDQTFAVINFHDWNSSEKWVDEAGDVAAACDTIYVPTLTSTTGGGQHTDFTGEATTFLTKELDKRTTQHPPFDPDVTAPTIDSVDVDGSTYTGFPQTAYDEDFTITATVSDTGVGSVKQIECYIKPSGGSYTSFGAGGGTGVDSTSPYSCSLNVDAYDRGQYTVMIVAIDTWYNNTYSTYDINLMPKLMEGCTTAYFIDVDCDGFGVGNEYLAGVDADDTDADINTLASVEAIYGDIDDTDCDVDCTDSDDNIKTWLAARGAQAYTISGDVYYIKIGASAGTANDITDPYPTFAAVKSSLGPGDLVVYFGGDYDCDVNNSYRIDGNGIDGSAGSPIVITSMPGETVAIFGNGNNQIDMSQGGDIGHSPTEYITIDTIRIGDKINNPGEHNVRAEIRGDKHIHLRYVEIENGSYCVYTGNHYTTTTGLVFDHVSVHDCNLNSNGNHNMYLIANQTYSSCMQNYEITNSLFYNNLENDGTQLIHMNGPTCGPGNGHLIDSNIFHTSGGAGFDFQSGSEGHVVSNNIFFNNNQHDFVVGEYSTVVPGAYVSKNVVVINNTFIKGRYNNGYGTKDPSNYAAVFVGTWSQKDNTSEMTGVDVINNTFDLYDSAAVIMCEEAESTPGGVGAGWTNTDYKNNILNNRDGTERFAWLGYASGCLTHSAKTTAEWKTIVEADGGSVTGNVYDDPELADISDAYCEPGTDPGCTKYPVQFDLRLASATSPGIGQGLSTYDTPNVVPSDDIRGVTRGSSIDLGAYQWPEQISTLMNNIGFGGISGK